MAKWIEVGLDAINRSTVLAGLYTRIVMDNPANRSGTLKKAAIYLNSSASNLSLAIFTQIAENTFTTRSHCVIGAVPSGYSEHNISLAIVAGDYIGYYDAGAKIERGAPGVGCWEKRGNFIPCTGETFGALTGYPISLQGWTEEVPIILKNFFIKSIDYDQFCTGFTITTVSDVKCHMYLRQTEEEPQKHLKPVLQRGIRVGTDARFCFVDFCDIEQEEIGDTLTHTFHFPAKTPGADPPTEDWPFLEPWGTFLTEYNPWTKYKEPEVPDCTFAAGVITITNPGYADCGIVYSPPVTQLPLFDNADVPLKIAFDNPEATANSTSSQLLIELIFRKGADWMTIYLCVACGAEWEHRKPWCTGEVAGRPYGWLFVDTGEHTINLLDWFHTFRENLVLSTDPTGWYLNIIAFALGTQSPACTDYLKNDYIGCYLPRPTICNQKPWAWCEDRYFYFHATSYGYPMVSTSPIFHKFYPQGSPPFETCDRQKLSNNASGFCQAWNADSQTFTTDHDFTLAWLSLQLNQNDILRRGPYCVKITKKGGPCWAEPILAQQNGYSTGLPIPGVKEWVHFNDLKCDLFSYQTHRIVVHTLPGWEVFIEGEWVEWEEGASLQWWEQTTGNPYPRGVMAKGCNISDKSGVWTEFENHDYTFILWQNCPSLQS